MEFPEGRGGLSWEPILENPEGGRGHMKNPFRGGGMDIFWNHTMQHISFSSTVFRLTLDRFTCCDSRHNNRCEQPVSRLSL